MLRYLCGMLDYGLDYMKGYGVSLVGYMDSYLVGCGIYQKSTFDVVVLTKGKVSCT